MNAVVYYEYGSPDVLQFEAIDKPVPGDGQVLVRVRAASANPYDWHFMRGSPYFMRMMTGLRTPKVKSLGVDMAGEIEAVGANVTRFRPGDEAFGTAAGSGSGSFADYTCASEDKLEHKPANLTFEQAAAVPIAGVTALQGLRDCGGIQSGQNVLINGASGGVGTFAVQIAKSLGAEVTGVCSTRNVDMVRSIGADRVIDYTREDFGGDARHYDLMLDAIGNRSLTECRHVLTSRGKYILVGSIDDGRWLGPMKRLLTVLVLSPFVSQAMVPMLAKINREDLQILKELLEAGKVSPVIDRQYGLDELPEAIRYLEEGHARGKVVITV